MNLSPCAESVAGVPAIVGRIETPGVRSINELPDILDMQEVAGLLRIHQKTVRLMALDGKIPAFRAGRLWRFNKTKIMRWLECAPCVV